MKFASSSQFKYGLIFFAVLCVVAGIFNLSLFFDNFFIFKLLCSGYESDGNGKSLCFESKRNIGWLSWMLFSLAGAAVGLVLGIWGRTTQDEAYLNQRYEKSAEMLGNKTMAVRIAGCDSLMSLANDYESMKKRCVVALLAYIWSPYDEKSSGNNSKTSKKNNSRSKPLSNSELPLDIQEAYNKFANIVKEYKGNIDDIMINLPPYFLSNKKKDKLFFGKTKLAKLDMKQAFLRDANFRDAELADTKFGMSDLQDTDFRGATIYECSFQKAILNGANFEGAKLRLVEFYGAKSSFVNFDKADLEGIYLTSAILDFSSFRHANLCDANLEKADLTGADLTKANLENADLGKADLTGIDLDDANLKGANLKGANLTSADLEDADLENANLENANLTDANLEGANLNGAKLKGANLKGTILEA